MASQFSSLFILAISIPLFFTLSHSLDCKSQKLDRTFDNCTDLHSLAATLHYTYTAANSSLSVAFAAAPPTPDGWVAWGINPTGGGMVGTQALVAFKHADGKIAVDLFNLTSYGGIDPVKKLSVETSDVSAVESGGAITIFATVTVPSGNVSQVWQVGPVSGGKPGKHLMKPENLGAKAVLPVSAAAAASGTGGGDKSGGAALVMGERFGLGFYSALVLVVMGFMSM